MIIRLVARVGYTLEQRRLRRDIDYAANHAYHCDLLKRVLRGEEIPDEILETLPLKEQHSLLPIAADRAEMLRRRLEDDDDD